jgi:hypothetical protein
MKTLILHPIQQPLVHQKIRKCRKVFAIGSIPLIVSLVACNVNAIEFAGNFHKGDESKTKGVSFVLADYFAKGSHFYWSVAYNSLDKVKVEWNNDELFFKVDTVEALVSYRHKIKSYSDFLKNITIEYNFGASVALTENKFTWPETPGLEEEVRYFSQENDINAVIGVGAHYKLGSNTSFNFGLKYQPSFSEFGDVTSVYVGVSYRFGRGFDY